MNNTTNNMCNELTFTHGEYALSFGDFLFHFSIIQNNRCFKFMKLHIFYIEYNIYKVYNMY